MSYLVQPSTHWTWNSWTDALAAHGERRLTCDGKTISQHVMADFFKILQQAQEMQGRLQQMQEELQHRTVHGSAGGGLVSVEADGRGQVKRVKIDPSLGGQSDVEMLEDLVVVAVNDAQKRATEMAQEEMSKLTGGMNLPFKLPI